MGHKIADMEGTLPPPISILSDDTLLYLVDNYLDDRSLGACLLAWRRFHVLDRTRLDRRKYRLATLLSLCAAGDIDGLYYALKHPDVFGPSMHAPGWIDCVRAAYHAGRARAVLSLMRESEPLDRFSVQQWSALALTAALRGAADPELVWLCHQENRPVEPWDSVSLVCACTHAAQSGLSVEAISAALDAIESLTGLPVAVSHDTWRRLSAQRVARPKLNPNTLLTLVTKAAEPHHDTWGNDMPRLIKGGNLALARDLLGDHRLAQFLRRSHESLAIDRPLDDVDAILWLYDHVDSMADSADTQQYGIHHLVGAVASSGRTDLFDAVEARAAYNDHRRGKPQSHIWARAYAEAAMGGHTAAVEWALGHRMKRTHIHAAFRDRRWDYCLGIPACYGRTSQPLSRIQSPLVIHRNRRDLHDLLLDRRPREGIPQDEIDARVDHMVDITVRDALAQGDLGLVRRLHLIEPRRVQAAVDQDRMYGARS
ncbi:hypothetical protein pqer_cds_931 [Pandoravirus quercus]|uniref:Uncharacterized protein n=2 Tax=Pandoravirus TaxID=2060084 RepID=A0A2U7UA80_9VIRU|nr:hypothetical protein pqer_cds_931 [Pandoravirus quercus]AVK75353.1 hypothetical protein pqer_cds_931 [Pandoravirus quercus]QBZ81531.1 hypothetical protein pclt_cds_945 [Pandoravirus celtis]